MKKTLSIAILTFLFCLSASGQTENQPCPSIEIVSPAFVIQPGETMFFFASVSNEIKNNDFKYKWSLDKGTIVEGQGTSTIRIATEGLSDTTITATFEIEGLPKNCKIRVSEMGVIAQALPIEPYDDYGKISWSDELTRLDSFFISLQQNPGYIGFVWMQTDEKESIASAKKHIERILKHIKYRKVKKERFIFAIEKSNYRRTRLITASSRAKLPECEDCEIIKGKDFR